MKENILGPRQWAFVVMAGGAACALPFLQTDNAPTRTDSASTSSQQDGSFGGSPLASVSISERVPSLPEPYSPEHRLTGQPSSVQRLPEWANADRSPFDDLVGNTAAKPAPTPPQGQVPMQPLRPWIAGPGESTSLVTASSPQRLPTASSPDGASARAQPSTGDASPWSDESSGFTPIEQLAGDSSHPASSDRTSSSEGNYRWPDQAVTVEELAQATGARDHELASALVTPPSTLPVAAQRFGQSYMSPEPSPQEFGSPSSLQGTLRFSAPKRDDRQLDSSDAANAANLPSLPASRKSHVIFQPGLRK